MEKKTKPKMSCKAKAVDLLSRSDQSKGKLIQKLRWAKYEQEEIEEVIEWLEEKHYINEEACCQRRFENMYEMNNCSVKQICVNLLQQGFQRDMIDECIPDDIHEHEYKSAMKLASHKFKAGTDPRKIMQYLYMKGFGYDISQNVTEDITADWNCDEEYE